MIEIIPVDTKAKQKQFVEFPFDLYKTCPQWVPPFKSDVYMMMNKNKHPFYEHSDADFFLALMDGKVVGRIAALENKAFNAYHKTKDSEFYLFECINNQQVANALFDTVVAWTKKRGLNRIVGPKGFGPLDGYGIQIEGQEHRQMMNMMNYNYLYYKDLVENYGFIKEVDFVSSYTTPDDFSIPEKVIKAAAIAEKRGTLKVKSFKSKAELGKWGPKIGEAYNKSFVNNWEYYPLTKREIKYAIDQVLQVVIPELFGIVMHGEEVVGFTFPFPDLSAAMQKNKGKLGPIEIIRLLREIDKTDWIAFNGIGMLPEYHGLGGNAILFVHLDKTMRQKTQIKHCELTQVAETAVQMRKDLKNLGVRFYKNHRVYKLNLK